MGPEWGETDEIKERMRRAYSLLGETVRNKQYGRAAYYLQDLLANAPTANINIYVHASNMYRLRAQATDDKAERMVYLDSLFMIYDKGVEYLGDKNAMYKKRFIESKAKDYRTINPLDRKGIAEHFRTAIEELGNDIDPDLILTYFNELSIDFNNDDVSTEEFLSEYDRLYPMVVALGTESQVKTWDAILGMSGAANCENLENIFRSQIEAEPENAELLEKVVALLNRAGCAGTDFYLKTAELYYNLNPSSKTAIIIAQNYVAKNDNATALRYFNDALNITTDPVERANLSANVAMISLKQGNYRDTYSFASRAAQADPKNPTAFFLMGVAQASAARSLQDEFQRQTVYWLAVDNLQQARQLAIANPSAGLSVSDINKNITEFQTGFPPVEELFMLDMNEGDPYTVNAGWITGKTTVRKRP